MADFNISDAIVRKHEGTYANDPRDRGGETYRGIARNHWPNWPGWALIAGYRKHAAFPEILDTDAVLQKLVVAFFKENFWDRPNLGMVKNQSIATELYDTGVNMSTGIAAIFLQRVLNATNKNGREYRDIEVDGKIGPNTLSVLNNHKRPMQVLKLLNCLQGSRYMDICENNPSQEIFMNSWAERIAI